MQLMFISMKTGADRVSRNAKFTRPMTSRRVKTDTHVPDLDWTFLLLSLSSSLSTTHKCSTNHGESPHLTTRRPYVLRTPITPPLVQRIELYMSTQLDSESLAQPCVSASLMESSIVLCTMFSSSSHETQHRCGILVGVALHLQSRTRARRSR
jgi:hypothetical protein